MSISAAREHAEKLRTAEQQRAEEVCKRMSLVSIGWKIGTGNGQ